MGYFSEGFVIILIALIVQCDGDSLEFVGKVLETEKLLPCSLFFFQDRFDNGDSINQILKREAKRKSYYSVKYPFPTETEISGLVNTVEKFHIRGQNISQTLNSPLTLPLQFPITVSNYRKRSDPCLVVILFLSDLRPGFIKQIYNLITPVFIPITRKDLDYFIFMTPERMVDKLLLMKELPARIKFKLGIGHSSKQKAFNNNFKRKGSQLPLTVVKTVCFFCDQGGPQIMQFPSKFQQHFEYFPDFVLNLNGHVIRISVPYIRARIEADDWTAINNARRGMWKNLFEEYLNLKFNFSYNIFVSTGKDGRFGGGGTGLQLPNGTWIGVTGDLVSGQAEFGIVTANTPKRIHYIDFTEAFFDVGFLTYVTAEGARIFSPAALLWPFDLLMWFCMFLSTLVAFAFFTLIIKATFWLKLGSTSSINFARRGMVSQQIWNFKYQIQFILTSFLDQDCVMPTFMPLRIFVAIWLFFTLVLTTIYRSKLVSLLAFPIIETLPATFEDLAFSSYKVGFMKHGDSAYNTLKASTDPVYLKLVKEMEVINGVGLECLEKVVTERYGCIGYDFSMKHLRERNLSEADTRRLVFSPSHTYNIFLGIATEGRSIYTINFSKWLSYTRAFHLADVWEARDMYQNVRLLKREWWFATNQSSKADKNLEPLSEDNLTLKHISGAFYVLTTLLMLCSVSFVTELFSDHKNRFARNLESSKRWLYFKMSCKICLDKMFVLKRRKMDTYT